MREAEHGIIKTAIPKVAKRPPRQKDHHLQAIMALSGPCSGDWFDLGVVIFD